ncbi:MAG: type VI secretion protein ImpB [Planctomycetota bacterium]
MLRWMFLDMNSFFASCEQLDDPSLRGRPVGVCPVLAGGSGAVIAASYEAKALGVGMGCRAGEARALCPDIALRKARPARYMEIHTAVAAAIDKHIEITKRYSIDEWSMRLMGKEHDPAVATELARRVKAQIADEFEGALPCSVGIAPSRLLAKTACELRKPDGLTVLDVDVLPSALAGMVPRDIPGIGPGMEKRLLNAGVNSIEGLWALSEQDCRRIWGSVNGAHFWMGLHGEDPVEPKTRTQSMSHAHVLPPKYRNDEDAHAIMVRLICKLGTRLRQGNFAAHRLRVSAVLLPKDQPNVSYHHGPAWSDECPLPGTLETLTILRAFETLWQRRPCTFEVGGFTPRKVAVDLGELLPMTATTANLFLPEAAPRTLSDALDTINLKFGPHTVHPAAMHAIHDYEMENKIAFGRMPEFDLVMCGGGELQDKV